MKIDPKWLTLGLSHEQVTGAVIVGWRLGVIAFCLWAIGTFNTYGVGGFARADEVDQKIATAVEPIKKELSEQRLIIESVAQQLTETLVEAKASEIRHLVSRRCKETDATERSRIIRELDRKQYEFAKLRGERYVVSCGEV